MYIHMYIDGYIRAICAYVHIYLKRDVHRHTHAILSHTYADVYIHACMHEHTHTSLSLSLSLSIHIYHIYIYIYIYIHT